MFDPAFEIIQRKRDIHLTIYASSKEIMQVVREQDSKALPDFCTF